MPPETEKNILRWVTNHISVTEDSIMRIILMNLHKLPITPTDALDILETLLKRVGDSVSNDICFIKSKSPLKKKGGHNSDTKQAIN